MTESVQIALIQAVMTALGLIISGVIAYYMAKLKIQGDYAARRVARVEEELSVDRHYTREARREDTVKLDNLAIVAASSHGYLNSEKAVLLQEHLNTANKLAELGDPVDIASAELAQFRLDEHLKAKAAVDAMLGTDAQKQGKP